MSNPLDSGALDRTALAALINFTDQAAEGDITGPEPQSLYCSRCGYELDDPDSHYRDPGSYALYCLLGAPPHEIYATIADAMQAEMDAGDISPVIWEARLATAARAELARTGQREVMS